jgi:DNA-binding GntR family transcriptional regulator
MGAALTRVGVSSMQDNVYTQLSEALMEGAFLPGESVIITDLARRFGTSTMPVRDAVRRLHAERALQIEPQRGVRVRLAGKAEIAEVIRLRLQLEPALAAMAATRISVPALQALADAAEGLTASRQDATPFRLLRLNKDLHFILYEAAAQPVTLHMVRMLWAMMGPVIRIYASDPAFAAIPDTLPRLIEAVRAHDAKATRRWVVETIRTPAKILLGNFAHYTQAQAG